VSKLSFLSMIFLLLFQFSLFPKATVARVPRNNINSKFSNTYSNVINAKVLNGENKNAYIWQKENVTPFNELILSWNALRPAKGAFSFYISVKHSYWSNWHKIAEWGANTQKTYGYSRDYFVNTSYNKVQLKRGRRATGFRVRVVAQNGADIKNLKALFVNSSDLHKFSVKKDKIDLPTIKPIPVRKQSQMVLKGIHERYWGLCAPTSTSIIVNYFLENKGDLKKYIVDFSDKVYDNHLNIYGNWPLDVAQAYDSCKQKCFFRIERLNDFQELYSKLKSGIPVAVSIRGAIRGGAKNYENGHFIVIVGWDNNRKAVLCVDPAFSSNIKTSRAYGIKSFLSAWGNNVSPNLSYVPVPRFG